MSSVGPELGISVCIAAKLVQYGQVESLSQSVCLRAQPLGVESSAVLLL